MDFDFLNLSIGIDFNDTNATDVDTPFATQINICIAATICATISVCGITANALVAFAFLRYRKLRNQFTILCVSLAGADIGVLTIFLIWAVPMTVTQSAMASQFPGFKMGQISLMFWFAGLYNTLSIAVNRFLAIASPVQYKTLFSWRNTYILIGVCWLLACLHEITYSFDGCDFFYDNSIFVWLYSTSYCGQMIGWILDLGYGVLFFFLVFGFNIGTFYKIRRANRLMIKHGGEQKTTNQSQLNQERRRQGEIRLFKLALIHSGIFELMLLSFHVLSRLTADPWGTFITTTFVWQIAHASNGYIYIVFNRDMRATVKGFLRSALVACRLIEKTEEKTNVVTLVPEASAIIAVSVAPTPGDLAFQKRQPPVLLTAMKHS